VLGVVALIADAQPAEAEPRSRPLSVRMRDAVWCVPAVAERREALRTDPDLIGS
jgi:hypothetical protein